MDEKPIRRLAVLREAFAAGKDYDLRKLGDDAADDAALSGERALAELSIAAYALHKLLSKDYIVGNPLWADAKKKISERLLAASKKAEKNDTAGMAAALSSIGDDVKKLERAIGHYSMNTYEKARIKQAARAHTVGLSMAKAAELMGADVKQLQSYIGGMKVHEEEPAEKGIGERLKAFKRALKK